MGNRDRSKNIYKDRVHQALREQKITMKKASYELGYKHVESFRKALNTFQKLQQDDIKKLAELTGKDESYFIKDQILTIEEDIVRKNGKVALHKGDKITLPQIGSNNYKKSDVEILHTTFEEVLWFTGLGEEFSKMDKNGQDKCITDLESWLLLFPNLHRLLSIQDYDQGDQVLESIEALIDGYLAKHLEK